MVTKNRFLVQAAISYLGTIDIPLLGRLPSDAKIREHADNASRAWIAQDSAAESYINTSAVIQREARLNAKEMTN